jgi:hypothetical protein
MSINQEDECCILVSPIKQNIYPEIYCDPNIIEIREFNDKRFLLKITNFLISVMELKKIIQIELNHLQYDIVLYSNGNYLDDSKRLVDYNITCKSIIHVISSENIIINIY